MKEIENVQENLKSLPKHTLNEGQKENIIRALRKKTTSNKRVQFTKPLMAFALLCATVFVLVLSSDNGLRHLFQLQVSLTVQQAEVFNVSHNQQVIGVEGKVGMLGGGQFVADDARRGAKMMLYFWGDPSVLAGKNFRVEARNTYNEKIKMSEGVFDDFLFGEDVQQVLTSFQPFSREGEWQLSFLVDNQLFTEFLIEVLPPLPKAEQYTLIDHPMELIVGKETEVYIESTMDNGKEIKVKLLNNKGNIVSEHVFMQDGTFSGAAGGDIYQYRGNLYFPGQGTWNLLIDGKKTKPFKN